MDSICHRRMACPGLVETLIVIAHFALTHADAAQTAINIPDFAEKLRPAPGADASLTLTARQMTPPVLPTHRQFVDELVFGPPVAFADARAAFVALARSLLGAGQNPQSDPG